MSERLIIKNFGPIKEAEFEFKRINVLIGEQATGKSTVAKLLWVCTNFLYLIPAYSPKEQAFEEGLEFTGLNEAVLQNSYVNYDCYHYSFIARRVTKKEQTYSFENEREEDVDFPVFETTLTAKSEEFRSLLSELERIKPNPLHDYDISVMTWRIPTSFLQNDLAKIMDTAFYLPTERGLQSIFSLGKSSIPNISDSLFNQFAELDQIARLFKKDTTIEPLNITYKNVDGKGFVKKNNEDTFYSLYNAASGYQSTIPVVLVIKYYNEIRKKQKPLIVEEPELNLFPSAQKKLIEYIVGNTDAYMNDVLMTTQSPYTLTSLNNLMYAYQVGQDEHDRANEIVEEKYWVNPDDVSAYRLYPDGTRKDIMDRELNQIDAGSIDDVSRQINEDWDNLLKIEVDGK